MQNVAGKNEEPEALDSFPKTVKGLPPKKGQKDSNGLWIDERGATFKASASDLERFVYCPRSWHLNKLGIEGKGNAIKKGNIAHNKLDENYRQVVYTKKKELQNKLIWSWWILIVVALILDGLLFRFADLFIDTRGFSLMLASLSIAWLVVGLFLVIVPWRRIVGEMEKSQDENDPILDLITPAFEPVIEKDNFKGGWWRFGSIEVTIILAAASISIHGAALIWAKDRAMMAFVILIIAMIWNGLSAYRLNLLLSSHDSAQLAREEVQLNEEDIVAYSDGVRMAGLFFDEKTGLRGRPDQIVRMDGRYVPIEQKTGRIPKKPHESHRIQLFAYLSLIEEFSENPPKQGMLRYGEHDVHLIEWNDSARIELFQKLSELHEAIAKGDGTRNHKQLGKCRSCSRRRDCDQRLV